MERYFATINSRMYCEIQDLSGHIAKAKDDIAHAQPNEIKSERIPSAGKELGAIVQETEGPTNVIMEAAEEIMAADSGDGERDSKAVIDDACMRIFEACSFQDVTGQCISKVVNTLTFIDDRLETLLQAFDGVPDSVSDEDDGSATLLNGAQLGGEGISENDVDSMFGEDHAAPPQAAPRQTAPLDDSPPPPPYRAPPG